MVSAKDIVSMRFRRLFRCIVGELGVALDARSFITVGVGWSEKN